MAPEGGGPEASSVHPWERRGCGVQSPETVVWLLRGGQEGTSQPTPLPAAENLLSGTWLLMCQASLLPPGASSPGH